jgi:hypothetical protein
VDQGRNRDADEPGLGEQIPNQPWRPVHGGVTLTWMQRVEGNAQRESASQRKDSQAAQVRGVWVAAVLERVIAHGDVD